MPSGVREAYLRFVRPVSDARKRAKQEKRCNSAAFMELHGIVEQRPSAAAFLALAKALLLTAVDAAMLKESRTRSTEAYSPKEREVATALFKAAEVAVTGAVQQKSLHCAVR